MSTQPNKSPHRYPLTEFKSNTQPVSVYQPPSFATLPSITTVQQLSQSNTKSTTNNVTTNKQNNTLSTKSGRKKRTLAQESQSDESQLTDENIETNTVQSLPIIHETSNDSDQQINTSIDSHNTSADIVTAELNDTIAEYMNDNNDQSDYDRSRDNTMPKKLLQKFKSIVQLKKQSKLTKHDWSTITNHYVYIGDYFYSQGLYKQCIRYMKLFDHACSISGNVYNKLIALQRRSESYEKLGKRAYTEDKNVELAIEYFSAGNHIADQHIKISLERINHTQSTYRQEGISHLPNAYYIKSCILLGWSECIISSDLAQANQLRERASTCIKQAELSLSKVSASHEKQLIYGNVQQVQGDIIVQHMNQLTQQLQQLKLITLAQSAVECSGDIGLLSGASCMLTIDSANQQQNQLLHQRHTMLKQASQCYRRACKSVSDQQYEIVYTLHEADAYIADQDYIRAAELYEHVYNLASANEQYDELLDGKYNHVMCMIQSGQFSECIQSGNTYNTAYNLQESDVKYRHAQHAKNVRMFMNTAQYHIEHQYAQQLYTQYYSTQDHQQCLKLLSDLAQLCTEQAVVDHHRLWHVEQSIRCYILIQHHCKQITDNKLNQQYYHILMYAYSNLYQYLSAQFIKPYTLQVQVLLDQIKLNTTQFYECSKALIDDVADISSAINISLNYAELQFNNGIELSNILRLYQSIESYIDQHAPQLDIKQRIGYKYIVSDQLNICYQLSVQNSSVDNKQLNEYNELLEMTSVQANAYKQDLVVNKCESIVDELNLELCKYNNVLAILDCDKLDDESDSGGEENSNNPPTNDINKNNSNNRNHDSGQQNGVTDDEPQLSESDVSVAIIEPDDESRNVQPTTQPRSKRARTDHIAVDQAARIAQYQANRKRAPLQAPSQNLDDLAPIGDMDDWSDNDDRIRQSNITQYTSDQSPRARIRNESRYRERISNEERQLRQSSNIFTNANRSYYNNNSKQRRTSVVLNNAPKSYTNQYVNHFLGERVIDTNIRNRTLKNAQRQNYNANNVTSARTIPHNATYSNVQQSVQQQYNAQHVQQSPVQYVQPTTQPVQPVTVYNTYNMFNELPDTMKRLTPAQLNAQQLNQSNNIIQSRSSSNVQPQPQPQSIIQQPQAINRVASVNPTTTPQYGKLVRVTVHNSTHAPFDITIDSKQYTMSMLYDIIDARYLTLTGQPIKTIKFDLQNSIRNPVHHKVDAGRYHVNALWLETANCTGATVPHVIAYYDSNTLTVDELFSRYCIGAQCNVHPDLLSLITQTHHMTSLVFHRYTAVQTEHYIALFRALSLHDHHQHITQIDMSDCNIKHDVIVELCQLFDKDKFANINVLKFNGITITADTWTILLKSINRLQHLLSLDCSHTYIDDTHLQFIGALLKPNVGGTNIVHRSLQSLYLTSTQLKCNTGNHTLINNLCHSAVLQQLSLNHCALSITALTELVANLQSTNITSLELGYLPSLIQSNSLHSMIECDTLYETLSQLLTPSITLSTQDNIFHRRQFIRLDLSQWPDYNHKLIDILCQLISRKHNQLHSLHLVNNNISTVQLNKFFDCVENNDIYQLTELNLSHNIITQHNKHQLCNMLYSYTALKQLILVGCMDDTMCSAVRSELNLLPDPKPKCRLIM